MRVVASLLVDVFRGVPRITVCFLQYPFVTDILGCQVALYVIAVYPIAALCGLQLIGSHLGESHTVVNVFVVA